ncbi:hypothetical protein E2320_017392 [Naja naja]|nr:hypothetical protein E2320_017392 [Naja naja]
MGKLFHVFLPAPCPIFTPLCVKVWTYVCLFFPPLVTPVDAAKSDTLFCCKIVKKKILCCHQFPYISTNS